MFCWKTEDLQVSIRNGKENDFMEKERICIIKKGILKQYFVPYDYFNLFYTEKNISRETEFPIRKELPFFTVKIDPEAKKSLILPQKNGKIAILYDKLKYSNPGEPGILYRISPDEFQQLQSPFWYRSECYEWVLCVPVKTVKLDESFQIRFMFIRTSPGFFYSAAPEVLRKETRLIRENGMEGLRMVFCVLPAVFDAATFPFLILIQLYK